MGRSGPRSLRELLAAFVGSEQQDPVLGLPSAGGEETKQYEIRNGELKEVKT